MAKHSFLNPPSIFLLNLAFLIVSCSDNNASTTSEATLTLFPNLSATSEPSPPPATVIPATPIPSKTPTISPPTRTPIPSMIPTKIATATAIPATPTPTEAQPETADLRPAYTESVHMEFMGAQIDASLITDGSLDPSIRKVTVGEQAYAEFVTRSVHGVYQKYHPDVTYETYMKMVGEVQRGERNPLDIAIPLYANDTRDGIPYQNPDKSVNPAAQKKYLVIPWYKGEAPKEVDGVEVRSVAEINIALVNGKKVKNISLFTEAGYIWGMGTNLDGDTLTFSSTITFIDSVPNRARNTAAALSKFKVWMISNIGKSITSWPTADNKLFELLLKGGLTVQ